MNIIEVIPISRGINKDTLSYFTSKEVSVGTIVDIPLRKKIIQGIIISIKKAEEIKADIKNAEFTFKKLDKIKGTNFFSKSFMDAVQKVADYYATSIGSVIDALVPEYILKNINKLKINSHNINSDNKIETIKEKCVIQGNDDERYGTWKSLIRQEFAKKRSVLFIVPTIEDAERSYKLLEKGVEGYAFMLHNSLLSKKIIETWNKIIKEEHPIIVIATGSFLSLPRSDIGIIIVERESSKAYKTLRKPFLDIRYVAEIIAEKKGIKIFFADNFLRIETLWRENKGEMIQGSPFKFRSLSTAKDALIDMKKYKTLNSNFKILSNEIEDLIVRTKNESEKMIILATRRGVSPTVVCGDCQNIVVCNNCNSPSVLHKIGEKSFFMCHRCGERRSSEEYCKTCGSWKLGMIGIGIDLIEQKIKDKFPDITIFKIDSDSITSKKAVHSIIHKFSEKPGSILLGTEMMLQYLHEKIENSAIISLDSLFSFPDFRIYEKIFYLLIRIRTITTQNFIVQTRKSDEKIFEYGLKGNMSDFYRHEIEERKKFNYPPFTILIKITLEGKRDNIIKEMEQAQNILDPYEVEIFPAFTQTVKGNQVLHGLIRIPRDKWPDTNLIQKIRLLSPSIIIKVDPETLL